MKIRSGQYEVTHYSDQDLTRVGYDPVLRKLEWILAGLSVIFLGVSGYAVWVVCHF